jgi:hypothetical protein
VWKIWIGSITPISSFRVMPAHAPTAATKRTCQDFAFVPRGDIARPFQILRRRSSFIYELLTGLAVILSFQRLRLCHRQAWHPY